MKMGLRRVAVSTGFSTNLVRHLRILFPLGVLVGVGIGALFGDVGFGLLAGVGFSILWGILFALHQSRTSLSHRNKKH
jgi:hypothetical protein